MALQQAFGFLQPILYDADFIPNPLANSTALDAAAEDHAFSNILSDVSRALFNDATYTLPPSPIPFAPEVSNEEEPTGSGVVLSSLKFYTGRRRGQSCSYNGFLYSHKDTTGRKRMGIPTGSASLESPIVLPAKDG